jgi:O-antigen/teichoic acid export membrane protein
MARRGVLNLVGVACSGIFSFVLLLTFTRTLSTSTYGALATVIALFTIVSNVGELGADTGFLREIPRLRVTARRRDIRIALVVGLGPILLVGVLSAVTAFAFAPLIVEALIGSQPDREVAQGLLRAVAPFFLVGSAVTAVLSATRGFDNIRLFVAVQHVAIPVLRPLLVLLVAGFGLATWLIAVAWALPLALGCAVGLVVLVRLARRAEERGRNDAPPRGVGIVAREFWSFSAARGVAAGLAVVGANWSLLALGALEGAEEAGLYSVVLRLVLLGQFAFAAVRVAIGPQIAGLLAQGRTADAEAVYQTATWWLMALSWPGYLLLGLFAPTALSVFGADFTAGAVALAVLCLIALVDMGTGNITLVLLMSGHSRLNLLNALAALTVNVALSLVLIPHLGILGAALAHGTGVLAENVAAAVEVRLLVGIAAFGSGYVAVAVAALVGFLGVAGGVRLLFGSSLVTFGLAASLGGAIFLALLWRWRDRLRLPLLRAALRGPRTTPTAM